MDTIDYKIGMLMKQKLYQQEGKALVSLYPEDKPRLGEILAAKLTRHQHQPADAAALRDAGMDARR